MRDLQPTRCLHPCSSHDKRHFSGAGRWPAAQAEVLRCVPRSRATMAPREDKSPAEVLSCHTEPFGRPVPRTDLVNTVADVG